MIPIFTLTNVSGFLTLEAFGEKILQLGLATYNWWYGVEPKKIKDDEFKNLIIENENNIKDMQKKILENEKIILSNLKKT